MKPFKLVALSISLTLAVFCAVLYTSCTKDTCKSVTCLNGGSCGGGACQCKKGIGGSGCQTIYRTLFANTYTGAGSDDSGGIYVNNTLAFTAGTDSNYTQMQMAWTNPGTVPVTFPIELSNYSTSGTNFTLTSTKVGTITYTGQGNVTPTSASVTITKTPMTGGVVTISLNNFNKQ